jgi:hypothetical protein
MVVIRVGQTAKWSAAWVRVMFVACRAGGRSSMAGMVMWRVGCLNSSRGDGPFEHVQDLWG